MQRKRHPSTEGCLFCLAQYQFDEIEDDGDGDAEDANEVDIDTGLDHLRDRHITAGIDDGIRGCADRQHEAER